MLLEGEPGGEMPYDDGGLGMANKLKLRLTGDCQTPFRGVRLFWGLGLGAIALLSVGGCEQVRQAAPSVAPAQAETPTAVDVVVAKAGSVTEGLTYTGTTQPNQQVSLRARVEGQILDLSWDVGDRVAAGDLMAQIEADLLMVAVNQTQAELQARQAEVAQARAAVSDAQTALETARVRLQQGQTDADRLARLAAEGAASLQAAEQAQLTVDTAQQVVRSAEEQIRTRQEAVRAAEGRVAAQAAVVAQAEERLSFTGVRSPLSGVVLSRAVETGDYVESGDEILRVGDLSQILVRIEVSDRDLARVRVGQPVQVVLDAFPDQTVSGRITQIAPAADSATRLIPVEVTLPNEGGRMGSGLLARVSLQPETGDRAVVLPKSALEIAENAPQPTVFVVNREEGAEGTVTARTVTLGQETQRQVEVTGGLSAGESVVVRSSAPLVAGQPVRLSILSEEPPSQPSP